jgi:lysophospholipid acyltransferase (LPLAT)-like uncharacterized protein
VTSADRTGEAERSRLVLGWRLQLALLAGWVVLRLLGLTWRVSIRGHEWLRTRTPKRDRVVFTLWHGQMLPILWAHEPRTGVLVSEHKDGELITRILERFGMFGVRGSTSRGGTRALLEAVQVVKGGTDMAFTPDGPRGPRFSYAPGALILAHRAEVPIVPITAYVDRAWRLRSWDRFEIPKPFARVTIDYGAPILLRDADVRAAADRAPEFAAALQRALRETAMHAGAPAGEPHGAHPL